MLSTPGLKYSMMDMVPPASLDGKDAGQLEDDILGAGPAGQLDPDHIGALELPGDVGHHVHSVSAAHTDTETAQTSAIGGVKSVPTIRSPEKVSLSRNSKTDSFQLYFIVIVLKMNESLPVLIR